MTPEQLRQKGDPAAIRSTPGRDVGSDPRARRGDVPSGWDEGARLELDAAVVPDLADVAIDDDLRQEIEAHMANYPDRHSAALPALSAAQRRHGWCSPEAVQQVAAVMQVTPAYLASVATFYDMLRDEPTGSRYVYVCTSVACHLRGAKAVFDAIDDEGRRHGLEGQVEIREFECLGACDMAPMASVDGRYVGPLDVSDAPELVTALKEGREVLPGRALEDRGYKLPWEDSQDARPEAEVSPQPAHPSVSPPGGTWKDMEADEVSAARHEPSSPAPDQPIEPGSMQGGKEDR